MPTSCVRQSRYTSVLPSGDTMKDRSPACALNRLLACALRPVAVPNGKRLGRFIPSLPIGSLAFTITPRLSRNACSRSIPGKCRLVLNALLLMSRLPLCSLGHAVIPTLSNHASNCA